MDEPRQPLPSGYLDTPQKLQAYLNSCPPGLTKLHLNVRQISSLAGVIFPLGLREVHLADNLIASLEGVHFPHELKRLYLSNNQIDSLEGVQFPSTLEYLYLANNRITTLQGVQFPRGLTNFNFQDNPLISLAGMINPTSIIKNYLLVHYHSLYLRDIEGVMVTLQAARQSQKATLKEMSDLSQHSMQNQLKAVTSFLREGMEARSQQHAEQLAKEVEERGKAIILIRGLGKIFTVPLNTAMTVQWVLDYLNNHYYISVLDNCGVMRIIFNGKQLEPGRTLADYNVQSGSSLNIVCAATNPTQGGSKKRPNKSKKRRNKSTKKYT